MKEIDAKAFWGAVGQRAMGYRLSQLTVPVVGPDFSACRRRMSAPIRR